ncbi:hypothetical protein LP421_33925 (plasmid) [Rhizobium sp. RCAM05350]|nr:hypothetical protein LP421_33925 [Rhizobium sp. RCAM05350]
MTSARRFRCSTPRPLLYAAALAAGQGDLDTVSTARVLERKAGITRSPRASS